MLDGFSITQGLNDLQGIANWILGTAFVLMVIAGCLGAVVWGGGKAFGSAKHTSWGIKAVYLTGIAALVLGSLGGGIKWSSTNDKTEGVMPVEAQKRNVNIDRPAVSTQCTEMVSVQVSNFRANVNKPVNAGDPKNQPNDKETEAMDKLAKEMGIIGKPSTSGKSKTASWAPAFVTVKDDEWKEYEQRKSDSNREWRISQLTWLPDGKDKDCSSNNTTPSKDKAVEVVVWERRPAIGSDSNYYLIFEVPLGPKKGE